MKRLFVVINENMLCSLAYAPMVNTPDVIGRALTVLDVKNGARLSRGAEVCFDTADTIRFATEADNQNFPTYAAATNALSNSPEPMVPTDELCELVARLRYEFEQASKQFKELAVKVCADINYFKGQCSQRDSAVDGYYRESSKAKAYKANLKPDHTYSEKAQRVLQLLNEGMDRVFLSPIYLEQGVPDEIADLSRSAIPDGDNTWDVISHSIMAHSWLATYHMHSRGIYQLYIRTTCMNESLRNLHSKMVKLNYDFRLVRGLLMGCNIDIHPFGSTHENWTSMVIITRDSDILVSSVAGVVKECRANTLKLKAEKPDLSIQI
ncbi:hypothetical protein ACTG16_23535 [Aeromonas sp. 23P]|uniref:hypothetical protein n=1 Tax=Aeromonas sp. 23P TaxID=3452716 RepID=UPI003F7900B1